MTKHHRGMNLIPLLSCQLHQELLAQGEHLTHHCQIGPTALVSANRIQYVKC